MFFVLLSVPVDLNEVATVLGAVNDAARRLLAVGLRPIIDLTWAWLVRQLQGRDEGTVAVRSNQGTTTRGSCHTRVPIRAVAHHGIEDDQQLAHAGDEDDLVLLADQTIGKSSDHRIASPGGECGHVEYVTHHGAAALDTAGAGMFAAVVIEWATLTRQAMARRDSEPSSGNQAIRVCASTGPTPGT